MFCVCIPLICSCWVSSVLGRQQGVCVWGLPPQASVLAAEGWCQFIVLSISTLPACHSSPILQLPLHGNSDCTSHQHMQPLHFVLGIASKHLAGCTMPCPIQGVSFAFSASCSPWSGPAPCSLPLPNLPFYVSWAWNGVSLHHLGIIGILTFLLIFASLTGICW